ncbi:uncharacterized protein [Choristoneura fumiferana]|uniref:uncharacterized protein n=1 Tax=Choristoneura fumiferana TaxID=7141 RepID=UPI003D15B9CB
MADEKMIKKRSCMKSKLTIFSNYVKVFKTCKEPSSLQLLDLESRFSKFDALYAEFDKLQSDIEMLSDEPDREAVEREQFEAQYHSLVAAARALLGARTPRRDALDASGYEDAQASAFKNNCVRLPKIDLPVFNGHYQHWLEFRDTFTSLIHSRQDIDSINKLHYLRASLKGSALLVIDNLDFKSENYESAWQLLCSRYDNKRLLVNNHVRELFNVEPMRNESYSSIRHIIDVTNKNLRALSTLDQPTEHWDTLIIHMMAEKLDSVTHRVWEEYRNTLTDPPSLEMFTIFLSNRAVLLETLQESKGKLNKSESYKTNTNLLIATNNQNNYNKKTTNHQFNKNHKKIFTCPLCNQNHFLFNCETFRALPIETRIHKAKETKVCLNCLRPGHIENNCNLVPCKYCKKRHNTLLHLHEPRSIPEPPIPSTSNINNFASSSILKQPTTFSHVLLSTALVQVIDSAGAAHSARMLLDNGSTANFVTQSLCGKLGLSRRSASSTVTGINNNTSYITQSCSLTMKSSYSDYSLTVDCLILPQITKALPSSFINIENIPLPMGISLADPSFNIPSVIDILVGADVFWSVLCNNSIDLGKNQPKLYETKLGWLVSGYVARLKAPSSSSVCHFLNEEPNPDLSRFWELDTVAAKHSLSPEERACEQSFLANTTRNNDGGFVVTMPLKDDPSVLGDSFQKAKCRFLSLERKFAREPVFKHRYMEFMREYEHLGHMTENKEPSSSCLQQVSYFIAHHGVIRESSLTTKLRAVFDASAASSSGISLNDIQMVGPTVQEDLYSILLRFRQHRYVVTGDIEKMYRAIEINPIQRSLQQIIFRYDTTKPLKTYTLNTVTYGTASAPYLATKCLVSLAASAPNNDVKQAIQRDFYVDDYLGGSSTIDRTINLCTGIIDTLKSAKFNLRKFRSNNQIILDNISPSSPQSENVLDISNTHKQVSSKTLGLNWISDLDLLSYSINIELPEKITKRHILSVISQIFDPLGLVGPCVVEAKIIMQRLWIEQCSWDTEVPDEIKRLWFSFTDTLPLLNQLKIPRWVLSEDSIVHELHIFSDSSERAYGACVYVRSVSKSGLIKVHLLTSKSRVAPIKPTTIPRLELCGALLAARLCNKTLTSLTIQITKCRFWCDSTIVLGWLNTPSTNLKSFVRNRVHEIQESTEGHTWSYVPSKDNPADLVSRGLKADVISCSSLWWSGPTYLTEIESTWPKMPNVNERHDLPELITCSFALDNKTNTDDLISNLIKNKSKLTHLQNTIAYLQRFIYNCRNPTRKFTGLLSIQDLQNSLNLIIRKAQSEMFPEEYAILKAGKAIPNKNRLISLSVFIDSEDIIRVGGRLANSSYCYDTKHPIVLCSKHHFTKILFAHYHLKYLHAPPQLLLNNIKQTYWPLGGKNLSKNIVHKCVTCFRHKAETVQPIMGQLPASRTELEYPFLHCSVDYAGPVLIADKKGRGCKLIKSYLAIFICNSVKACHIELVTSLSCEAFIAALNRFVSRRGKPQSITSDNATTFVGTCNELAKLLVQSDLQGQMAQEGIEFKFVPAYTPHFNGLAESCVRSTKFHLKRLLQTTHLTYEEMATCLAQIEAVLNSRPLTPLSSDPSDLSALTPAHFLIGRSFSSIPHPQVTDTNINRLERFKRIELLKQHFWNRFSLEYVHLLQQRVKWQSSLRELKLGLACPH